MHNLFCLPLIPSIPHRAFQFIRRLRICMGAKCALLVFAYDFRDQIYFLPNPLHFYCNAFQENAFVKGLFNKSQQREPKLLVSCFFLHADLLNKFAM